MDRPLEKVDCYWSRDLNVPRPTDTYQNFSICPCDGMRVRSPKDEAYSG